MQAIIANTGWLTFDRTIKLFIGLAVGTWVARYLGPEAFGELSYCLVYISFFQVAASFGLDSIVIREIARDKMKAGEILGSAFVLKTVMGITCWIIAVLTIGLLDNWNNRSLFFIGIIGSGLLLQATEVIDFWFQSENQVKRTIFAKLLSYIISNMLRVLLIIYEAPLIAFLIIAALDFLLVAIGLVYAYRYFPSKSKWIFKLKQSIALISSSWALCVATLIGLVQARIEFLIIENFLGLQAVGQYSAALRWIEFFSVPGVIITLSIYPTLAALNTNIEKEIQKTYFIILTVFFLTLPFMIAAWAMMDLLYGSEYLSAKSIFILMLFRPLLAYLGTVRSISLKLDGKIWYELFCAAIGALIALTSAPFFIETWGLVGAVFSAYLSYTISNILIDIVFYRKNVKNLLNSIQVFRPSKH